VKVTILKVFSFQTLKMFQPASPNQMDADPQNSCADILSTVRSSGLTWGLTETPYSLFLTVRKRYLKIAKISSSKAKHSPAPLGVVEERLQIEKLHIKVKEGLQALQKLQNAYDQLKLDYEDEVNNSEKLNNGNCVAKALVSTLQIELAHNTDIIKAQNNTADDLAKSEAEVTRLQNKLDDSLSTVTKLRDNLSQSVHLDKLCQALAVSRDLKVELEGAQDKARIIAYSRAEVSKLKVKLENSKCSNNILETQLMSLLSVKWSTNPPTIIYL
jgi:hypothetical protein